MWGGADYERMARQFASIHDDLVGRLDSAPGVDWLDVATGTGGVALRAAAAGAAVTGVDIAEALLDQARAKARAAGVQVEWRLGDAQALPLPDASFDVVSSCFGLIFAPDASAVADEVARVCRPGGRLGLTSWRPDAGPHTVFQRFSPGEVPTGPDQWATEAQVERLLGGSFELAFDEGVWNLVAGSPEEALELIAEGAPPVKAMVGMLEPKQRAAFRAEMLDYWAGFERDGRVLEPRPFLIVEGRRR
jgi:ubiquinone/menaquinone biosynthesis C-methylase UbiE